MALNLKKKSVEILRNFLFFPFKFCLTSKRHEAEIRINYKKKQKHTVIKMTTGLDRVVTGTRD